MEVALIMIISNWCQQGVVIRNWQQWLQHGSYAAYYFNMSVQCCMGDGIIIHLSHLYDMVQVFCDINLFLVNFHCGASH